MSFRKPPTKAELRQQLRKEIDDYLKQGGTVEEVPKGISGRTDNTAVVPVLFDSPKKNRTYVNDVVATIDQRKKPAKPAGKTSPASKGYYKTIYDDFGEPIRKVWVDE